MLLLLDEYSKPFAIVKDNTNNRIERAIAEEYILTDIKFSKHLVLPDWGETVFTEFFAKSEDGKNISYKIEIMKIVEY